VLFRSNGNIGKPTGIDIKENKMTLPLIYAINHAERKDKRWLVKTVKHFNTDKEKVQDVIDYVALSGGIEYARNKMHEHRDDALKILHSFEESEARSSLEALVNYTIERKK